MKKKIDFISLSPSLAEWLRERLRSAPSSLPDTQDLLDALGKLLDGSTRTLMLELESDQTASPSLPEQICCGALCIQPRARKVVRQGVEVSLTPKEFDILYFLARNRGEVFTKEQIYQAVWDGEYLLDDSNIMAFIRKLRKKIEPNPDAPEYILTIWGIGYKFNDRLEEEEDSLSLQK